MKCYINDAEFELHEGTSFTYSDAIVLYIKNDSADEIVETIGESATVSVPEEYTGTDLVLDYIRRFWDSGNSVCETAFKPLPVRDLINQQSEDIEVISQAITELAEIIGGAE